MPSKCVSSQQRWQPCTTATTCCQTAPTAWHLPLQGLTLPLTTAPCLPGWPCPAPLEWLPLPHPLQGPRHLPHQPRRRRAVGDLHHHHHKVCSPADHLEHVCSWIGLLYNVGHTEGLCYLSIYYLSPHVTGLIMRHLEQWDLTNWENSLTVSIPHPSPEPQHLFFVSPSQVDSIGHSQYGVQLFAKNPDSVKLMQVGNGNLAVSPANHWLTELARQGLNPQPLSGVVWRGLWVSQLTRHFVRGTGTCWKYAQETWQNTWVFL